MSEKPEYRHEKSDNEALTNNETENDPELEPEIESHEQNVSHSYINIRYIKYNNLCKKYDIFEITILQEP